MTVHTVSVLAVPGFEIAPDTRAEPVRRPGVVAPAAAGDHRREDPPADIVDTWGVHSFPASDPPANW